MAFEGTPAGEIRRPVVTDTFWRDRPVLVTGGAGLVGSWLVRRLVDARADVTCLLRDQVPQSELVRSRLIEQVKVVWGDVCDQPTVERVLGEYEIDTVFHLAAQTIVTIANRNPASTFETNIAGTWRLLEACRRSPLVRQVVVASSDKAYGDQEVLPYDEKTALRGTFPYDVSKACADLLARSYAVTFGIPVVVSRCANFFGGGDLNFSRLVPGTIRSILRNERPVIRSDGKSTRDYLYVEDGATAYMTLAERLAADASLRGEAFNFSLETRLSVRELVEKILATAGVDAIPDIRNEANNEIRNQYLSSARARNLLGWKPAFTLDQGLIQTIEWYRQFFAS